MFWLFAGDNYYPSYGLGDYRGAYSFLADAELAGQKLKCDWYCIITADKNGELTEVG